MCLIFFSKGGPYFWWESWQKVAKSTILRKENEKKSKALLSRLFNSNLRNLVYWKRVKNFLCNEGKSVEAWEDVVIFPEIAAFFSS